MIKNTFRIKHYLTIYLLNYYLTLLLRIFFEQTELAKL